MFDRPSPARLNPIVETCLRLLPASDGGDPHRPRRDQVRPGWSLATPRQGGGPETPSGISATDRDGMTDDVGLTEIVTLEDQGSPRDDRDCVRDAIAHREPCRMMALVVAVIVLFGRRVMLAIEGQGGSRSARCARIAQALPNPFAASTVRASNRVGPPIRTASSRRMALNASASGSLRVMARMAEVLSAIPSAPYRGRLCSS
jgi:hypothetical protein